MPIPFLSVIDVRAMIRDELRRAGLVQDAQKPGLPVVFRCSCPRESCRTTLIASPRPEGRIHLASAGVSLDQEQRDTLADLLRDETWNGDHADLGP